MADESTLHPSHKRSCMCRPLNIPRTKPTNEVYSIMKDFNVTDDDLKKYMKLLMADLHKGLAKATHAKSIVKCYPTYIQDLPSGQEVGRYLALDLGGTNFRVIMVDLQKNHFEMTSRTFVIPNEKMLGSGKDLFDHVAACLHLFIMEQKLNDECLPLGFTYSFPLIQKAIDRGIIERWTKGFKCDDIIGEDVVKVLQEALVRKGINKNVIVKAVINDTAGTLIACAWKSPYCKVGLIVGTGTNACYVEKQQNAEMFDGANHGSGLVLINCEWGAFGDDGCLNYLRKPEDIDIDKASINPGKQLHEKMISGMYMGELVRLLILKCVKGGAIFGGKSSSELNQKDKFLTKYVSDIESEKLGTYDKSKAILESLGLKNITETDFQNVRYICECVSRRAAFMCSAGLATLIKKTEEKRVTVGIDGSVYRYHPHFHNLMMEKMKQLVTPGVVFDLMLSEDGSGRGAALTAASAS
ncbi:hexokinase type 2-like [Harmonia axyridis]|uniref:hexokinase type 2-like n=1 Tax=Harmonia axyridis TaxID=115357 RepID=UPI001E27586A|nr:hexokinase type 2-like [Harmonia axyridis]